MTREEATRSVIGEMFLKKINDLGDAVATIGVEARFYTGPEWNAYRDQVLEPRYRQVTAELAMADETAKMLRLQGEARALRYQIDRSESVTNDLREKKEQLEKAEQALRDAAGGTS